MEHSRIYCFGEGKDRVMYISSADLMTRNTDRRVEIATPVLDKDIENEIYKMLEVMLADNVNARKLLPDGHLRPRGRRQRKGKFPGLLFKARIKFVLLNG